MIIVNFMIACTDSGSTLNLDTTKFLPDIGQAEFLKNVINMFNLYFTIDVPNKIINFETYDVLFTNKVAPYDITNKVMSDTISIEKAENMNNSLSFKDSDNMKVLGDNTFISGSTLSALDVEYLPSDENTNKKIFNYIGTSTNKIDVGFGVPAMKRMFIRNEWDYNDADFNAGDHVIFIPNISKQTPQDNDNKVFNKNDADTVVFNTEDTIQHKGNVSLYYYYGLSNSNLLQKPGVGLDSDYYYVYMDGVNQKIPFCSPFIYMNYRDQINYKLNRPTYDADSVLASYVQTPYLMLGTGHTTTDFSLIFSDNGDYGDTLFTKFFVNKYKRYDQGEVLRCNMLMTHEDWDNMTINQPIKYNNQIYSLMSINNYDIVKGVSELSLIKQL